jgi:excisionase family DNA binding protein
LTPALCGHNFTGVSSPGGLAAAGPRLEEMSAMGIKTFIKGELLEIIEWTDATRDTLSFRFPDEDKAIKRGAQLIVRESQTVQFVYLGEFGDTFAPGKHRLTTDNIPVLTRLKSWKFGLESPFKADVYFVNTRLFTGNKWGTSNPIMLRDADFGIVRARAFGIYDFRIVDPKVFLREVAGSDHDFKLGEFDSTMRSRVVSVFSDALATSNIPVLDAAKRYTELGEALLPLINPVTTAKYGIEITSFVLENVSVPPEVEEAIDKRASMTAIGNLNDFVKYQMGQGMGIGAGGAGGMASEMAMGLAIAQQMMQQHGGQILSGPGAPPAGAGGAATAAAAAGSPTDILTPAQIAAILKVEEPDVVGLLEAGELQAKKIGANWRIRRAALDAYLAN